MLPRFARSLLVALLICTGCLPAKAQGDAKPEKEKSKEAKVDAAKESLSTTRHLVTIGTTKLEYEATAGTLTLKDDEGKNQASIFFTAYTRTDVKKPANRPLTFLYNGGPGSSSVWLHLGAFGPRRVNLAPDGKVLVPPYRLIDNEATLLDVSDLVFVDPVMTGFSRPAPGVDVKRFLGVQEDVKANAAFIHQYLTRFGRWDSPKFLAGESYGTTRCAALAGHLQQRDGINLNGIILISTVLNFQTIGFDEGNDLPYVLYLPTFTATAWYHKKLSAELQEDLTRTLAAAEKFALGPYTLALMKGSKLTTEERDQVARDLARFTGLNVEYVRQSNLRIDQDRFCKELLRKEERIVGRFDSRFLGTDRDTLSANTEYDPSYVVVRGPFTALVNQYLRRDLRYETALNYHVLGHLPSWSFDIAKNRYLNVAPSLRSAMTQTAGLRLFVANGRYDLATPYFATQYTLNHHGLKHEAASTITVEHYPAGHMMYIEPVSLLKLKKDLAQFILASVPGGAFEPVQQGAAQRRGLGHARSSGGFAERDRDGPDRKKTSKPF